MLLMLMTAAVRLTTDDANAQVRPARDSGLGTEYHWRRSRRHCTRRRYVLVLGSTDDFAPLFVPLKCRGTR